MKRSTSLTTIKERALSRPSLFFVDENLNRGVGNRGTRVRYRNNRDDGIAVRVAGHEYRDRHKVDPWLPPPDLARMRRTKDMRSR